MEFRGKKLIYWCLLGVLLAIPVATRAQAGEDDLGPYEPPVLAGGEQQIELLRAVLLTLDNDPALLLRAEDVARQLGRYQESSGLFDWTFIGQFQWEHREQELTEGAKRDQRDKRNQLRDLEAVACPEEQNLGQRLQELNAVQQNPGVNLTTDDGFNTQLLILNTLINSSDNQAQQDALEDTRDNFITTEIDATNEAFLAVRQACARSIESLELAGAIPEEEEFNIARLDLRLQKNSRRGLQWTPFVKGAYQNTQFIGKRDGFFVPELDPFGQPLVSPSGIPLERLVDFGGKNVEDFYQIEVGFEVNIPLLRNRGRDVVAASETASRIDWEASEVLLRHSATRSVLNTSVAYWNLVAAQERIHIFEESVRMQEQVAEITQALIDAEELPGAEASRSLAGVSNARAQLRNSARDAITAQLDLARAIGLSVRGEENVPVATSGFPPPPSTDGFEQLEAELVRHALDSRLDLEASRWLIDSGKVLARAAVINLRSRWDLILGTSAWARGEGTASDALDTWIAPSWKLGTSAEKPIGNRSAKGRLAQAESQVRQRQISRADLGRLVSIAVVRTLSSLTEAREQLHHAESAAEQFEKAIETEIQKLRLGETTLLDAILTEQQRTNSQLALVASRFQVARLVAELRFETGAIATREGDSSRVTWETLTTVPSTGGES